MRRLALALGVILLLPMTAYAGQTEVDHIAGLATEATDAWEAEDTEAYEAAKRDLYEVVIDPQVSPACRRFADVSLLALNIVDIGVAYPEMESAGPVFQWALQNILVTRNNCLLAI